MLSLVCYLGAFVSSIVLLFLVDTDSTKVSMLEYLVFGSLTYSAFCIFKIILKLYQEIDDP